MSEERRITQHNGRKGKSGAYSVKHNDRDFDLEKADHIDSDLTQTNVTQHIYSRKRPEMTFEEAEKHYYEKHFSATLEERNAKQIASRHKDRVMTMDDYRRSTRYCPEETIIQLGDRTKDIDKDILQGIISEQMKWEHDTFPQVKMLNIAFHYDEPNAAFHCHIRRVWVAKDDKGQEYVSQKDALKQMGVERPDKEKPESRYNNAKMTHSKACREHLLQLCRERGIEFEETPKEPSKSGKTLEEFKAERLKEEIKDLKEEHNELEEQIKTEKTELANINKEKEEAKEAIKSIGGFKGVDVPIFQFKTDKNGYIKGGQLKQEEYDILVSRAFIGTDIVREQRTAHLKIMSAEKQAAELIDKAQRRATSIVSDAIMQGAKQRNQGREKDILWDLACENAPELVNEAVHQADIEMEIDAIKMEMNINQGGRGRGR